MLNSYYFRHSKGYLLSPVYAKTIDDAWQLLVTQHSWCDANVGNCRLVRVIAGTEWDRQLSSMDVIKQAF